MFRQPNGVVIGQVLELACGAGGVGMAAAERVGGTGQVVLSDVDVQVPILNLADFPESERACAEVLALPVYPELGEEQVRYVATELLAAAG